MSQNDMSIANADGATVRADMNSAFQALASSNSGASAPSTTYAYQLWADTATGLLKQRNAANSAWVTLGTLASTGLNLAPFMADGRLTLATATPVTTSDQTAKTTLYYTPYTGNKLALYDGSIWLPYTFSELSIAVPATTNTMYDAFVYLNSGTPALELTAWTNDTTRATGLVYQDGVLVKSGATTRRYVGSFRTTGSSGQTEDSLLKRYVWNYYNRVDRVMRVTDSTNSWNYSTASYQQANNSAANQIDFVVGVSEDPVDAFARGGATNSTGTARAIGVGIGLDSATTNSAHLLHLGNCTSTMVANCTANYTGHPGIGRHYLAWLEYGAGSDTQTWYGDNGNNATYQSGIQGTIRG
jgi:hypothetical protein